MKIRRYIVDVIATYLIIQIVGLVVGFVALGLERQHLRDGMLIGLMITAIPTIVYAVAYVLTVRLMSKHSASVVTHILIAWGLTVVVYAGYGALLTKDKLSLTSIITWQTLISCLIAASCAALFMWSRAAGRIAKKGD